MGVVVVVEVVALICRVIAGVVYLEKVFVMALASEFLRLFDSARMIAMKVMVTVAVKLYCRECFCFFDEMKGSEWMRDVHLYT